jgi:hypothetical protein
MHVSVELPSRPIPTPQRGAIRHLHALGYATLAEFPLKSGRRADILALSPSGDVWIVEVKSCLADYRSDRKWTEYAEWCDSLFFAVGPDFPHDVLPSDAGLLIADAYDGEIVRYPECAPISAARRKALTLRFARLAALRLSGQDDAFGAAIS